MLFYCSTSQTRCLHLIGFIRRLVKCLMLIFIITMLWRSSFIYLKRFFTFKFPNLLFNNWLILLKLSCELALLWNPIVPVFIFIIKQPTLSSTNRTLLKWMWNLLLTHATSWFYIKMFNVLSWNLFFHVKMHTVCTRLFAGLRSGRWSIVYILTFHELATV